jgi:hypothetical protein
MGDLPLPDELRNFGKGDVLNLDVFGRILSRNVCEYGILDQISITAVSMNGGVGVYHAQKDGFIPRVTRFFEKLAAGCFFRGVPLVEHSPGNLQGEFFRSKTVLFNQDDFTICGERNDVDPVWRIDKVKNVLLACPRRAIEFFPHGKNPARLEDFGMKMGPGLGHGLF